MNTPKWMRIALLLAAAYNILWGAWVVLYPASAFQLVRMAPINYPQIWQCVGMIVGVYGVGYAIAATNPVRHWPIVLVGLLGKLLGPVGFFASAIAGQLPWRFGLILVSNDFLWWVPFTLILFHVWKNEAEAKTLK